MKLDLKDIKKRFAYQWVLNGVSMTIKENSRISIIGSNGSGKSTLLKIICGILPPTTGIVQVNGSSENLISSSRLYRKISFSSPYQKLIEDYTLREFLYFHDKMKGFINSYSPEDVIEFLDLHKHKNKQIQSFSSGMKQRVNLAVGILSDSELMILDEPGSNLDAEAHHWYLDLLDRHSKNRALIIASNDERDFKHCNDHYHLQKGILIRK